MSASESEIESKAIRKEIISLAGIVPPTLKAVAKINPGQRLSHCCPHQVMPYFALASFLVINIKDFKAKILILIQFVMHKINVTNAIYKEFQRIINNFNTHWCN
jgi:hypothetical protein